MEQQQLNKDPELWELARRRAAFKSHFLVYLVMVPFFWLIWILSGADVPDSWIPWPVWPTAGWGIGLIFHFLGVYVFQEHNLVDKEYEKLVREKKN